MEVTPTAADPLAAGGSAINTASAFEALPGISMVLLACVVLFVVLPLLGGGPPRRGSTPSSAWSPSC